MYTPTVPSATPPATLPLDVPPCVKVEGISASWSYESEKMVLSNISMEVNKVSQWDYCINQSSLIPRPRGLRKSALFLRPRDLGMRLLPEYSVHATRV